MIDVDELRLHVKYDPLTGDLFRVGVRDCHGNWSACNYKITGKTRSDKYGYYRVSINGRRYVAHQLAWLYMTGEWPDTIDHQDGDGSNNKWENLRKTDRHGNMRNLKLRTDNPTGHVGVAIKDGLYYAHAQREGERLFAGYFKTIDEAIAARATMNKTFEFHENHGSER